MCPWCELSPAPLYLASIRTKLVRDDTTHQRSDVEVVQGLGCPLFGSPLVCLTSAGVTQAK